MEGVVGVVGGGGGGEGAAGGGLIEVRRGRGVGSEELVAIITSAGAHPGRVTTVDTGVLVLQPTRPSQASAVL